MTQQINAQLLAEHNAQAAARVNLDYETLGEQLARRGVDIAVLKAEVAAGQAAMAHRWPVAQETAAVTVSGCVVGVPQVSSGRVRFELVQLQGAAPARRPSRCRAATCRSSSSAARSTRTPSC